MSDSDVSHRLAFLALQQLSGLKYVYHDIIPGAIESVAVLRGIPITPEIVEVATEKVHQGLKNLGYLPLNDRFQNC